MRLFILTLLCSFFTMSYFAQSIFKGQITDEVTNELMPGVSIYIPDLHKGDATDLNGNFIINNIPNGQHKIQISYIGYETQIENILFENNTVELNITLHSTVTETHEVVISGGYVSSQDKNAVKIDVIGMEQIQNSGSNTLMESLSETPGVNQLTTGVGIGKPIIRGLSGNRVLVVYDGFRQENQQWGSEHGLGVSEIGIEKAEVLKGPASLIYGSDALGGVLHLIREKNAQEGEIKGDVQMKYFDNTNGALTSLGVKGNTNDITWLVRAGNSIHSDYRDGNNRNIGNSRYKDQDLSLSSGIIRKWGMINLSYDRYDQQLGLPSIETIDYSRDYAMKDPHQEINQQSLNLKNSIFLKKTKLRLNLSTQQNNRKEYENELIALHMLLNTNLFDIKAEHAFNDKLEMIVGSQGMHQENHNSGTELLIPDAITNNAGVYTMWKYSKEAYTLHMGLRYDESQISSSAFDLENGNRPDYNFKFSSYSAAVGSTYDMGRFLLFRANVAKAFRSPNLAELTSTGVHEGANRYELGNENLTNEQNIEVDLSTHLHSEHINTEIAGFYNYIENYIFLNPTGTYFISSTDSVPLYVYNQNNARLYGGEITFDYHPHPIDWLHYEITFEMVHGNDVNGKPLPLMPANSVYNELRAENKLGKIEKAYFEIGLKYVFAQNRIAENELKTNEYELVNVGIGGDIKWGNQTVNIGITVKNLLNKKYYSHLSRLKQYGILDQGRSLVVNVKIPFGLKNSDN